MSSTAESKGTILIADDEVELAEVVRDYLLADGYNVQLFPDGAGVIEYVKDEKPSLLILDIMMPVKDGLTICEEVRAFSNVPIIMMTAKIGEQDAITGLDKGADDYLCKPVRPGEIVARVRAVLRRFNHQDDATQSDPLTVNSETYEAFWENKKLDLTPMEFRILACLQKDGQRVYTRATLLDLVHPESMDSNDRIVDTHIKNLRKKLSAASDLKNPIKSVYGLGYKLNLLDE